MPQVPQGQQKGWLQKIAQLPALGGKTNLPAQTTGPKPLPPQSLPNATVIYGIGAALLFVASFSLLLHKHWFPALAVFALGACLTGFALHLLKHQD